MKYIIRLNPKAFNPLIREVIAERLWEVEQCAWRGRDGNQDSEKVIWHCADVRIDSTPIRELYKPLNLGEKVWEWGGSGICVRGQDNVIEIKTGSQDASGN